MSASDEDWLRANQTALFDRLANMKRELVRHAGDAAMAAEAAPATAKPDIEAPNGPSSALTRLTEAFGLSPFERDILVLCAGMELDATLPGLCAAAQRDPARPHPTFGLALAVLPGAHWSAVSPDAPLRRWRLIDVGNGQVLTRAPLRIDERVLHDLVGIDQLDERLAALIDPLPPLAAETLAPSQAVLAERVAEVWSRSTRGQDMTVVQLSGASADCRPIAAAAAGLLGLRAASLPAERLPASATDLDSLLRLWEREAVLSGLGVLLVDCDDNLPADSDAARARGAAIALLLERAGGPVILREREPRRITIRPATNLEAAHPTAAEQLAIWRESLGPEFASRDALAATTEQFSLSPSMIRSIAAEVGARAAASPMDDPASTVWELCRHRLRSALDGLARRIDSEFQWDDLVLPPEQKQTLRVIAAQLRQRSTVHDLWGFARKSRRGLGISALFHGPSGTGKTMAAEVLASELRLDLYHIDLSRIVSKYIGETEANLRRVFDAAEENGAILLFDEADSLFGTRSQVKDSHDRYANIEVSYLLQRMEAYRGLAILTTNMRSALDPAFLRRIRFAMQFPFPDAPQRAAIWRKVFPEEADTLGLDHDRLARLRIAGGNIRNIALNAAFLAADARQPVAMHHLREAAYAEYAKLDRRLTQAEIEAWA
jgi:AAA+ superfamily predicted ATPase